MNKTTPPLPEQENTALPPTEGAATAADVVPTSRLAPSTRKHIPLWEEPAVRQVLRSKLFWAVLLLKVVVGSLFASHYPRDLFVPFTNYFVQSGFQNPYQHFLAEGRVDAFPYPPLMLFLLTLPRLLLTPFLSGGTDTVTFGHLFALRLPLLIGDVAIALTLARWFSLRVRRVLWLYWCCPIVMYICYWHGQLDIIPTALFLVAMHYLRYERYPAAMLCYGLALATKSHLWVAMPFVLVYIAQQGGRAQAVRGLAITAATYAVCLLPYVFDPSFRQMVFGTEETKRLFAFHISVGESGPSLLFAPLAILLVFFRFCTYPKRNWDLFTLYLSLVFSLFVLLVPPRPAYMLWSIPFALILLCRQEQVKLSQQKDLLPYILAVAAYFAFFWTGPQSDLLDAWKTISPEIAARQAELNALFSNTRSGFGGLQNLSFTFLQGGIAGLILTAYLFGIRSNQVYKNRNKPVMLGIAGDSGSGKDSFTRLLPMLLGEDRIETIAGDDYHRWPRGHEGWKVYSHLDVRGNNLHQQMEHAIALSAGNTVHKVHYDHDTGKFTDPHPVNPNSFLVFQGLHSLSLQQLRDMYDLRIFLDPDEGLRRLWKVQRDRRDRGYTVEQVLEALRKRDPDRQKFILSQRSHADLIVVWQPLEPLPPDNFEVNPELALEVHLLNSFALSALVEAFETKGIRILDYDPYIDAKWQSVRLAGDISADDLRLLAQELVPNIEEVSISASFVDGLEGCLQLIFLTCLSYKLRFSNMNAPSAPRAY
jgi:uridine kinase